MPTEYVGGASLTMKSRHYVLVVYMTKPEVMAWPCVSPPAAQLQSVSRLQTIVPVDYHPNMSKPCTGYHSFHIGLRYLLQIRLELQPHAPGRTDIPNHTSCEASYSAIYIHVRVFVLFLKAEPKQAKSRCKLVLYCQGGVASMTVWLMTNNVLCFFQVVSSFSKAVYKWSYDLILIHSILQYVVIRVRDCACVLCFNVVPKPVSSMLCASKLPHRKRMEDVQLSPLCTRQQCASLAPLPK